MELAQPEPIRLKKDQRHTIEAVVDRLVIREGDPYAVGRFRRNRAAMGRKSHRGFASKRSGTPRPAASPRQVGDDSGTDDRYSTEYGNAETEFSLGELTPKHFSFNSHLGACPACHGLGTQLVVDAELMISDPAKSIAEGAIVPWRRGTKRMQAYYVSCRPRW